MLKVAQSRKSSMEIARSCFNSLKDSRRRYKLFKVDRAHQKLLIDVARKCKKLLNVREEVAIEVVMI